MKIFKKPAFTLAEIMIAVVIIGVIAAFVIPAFIARYQMFVDDKKYENVVAKVTSAVNLMRANGDITEFKSTDEFVDVLQKYLKIDTRCSSSEIAECWPTIKVKKKDNEPYFVDNAKTRANLGFSEDDNGENPNVGLILADGTHMILSYDINAPAVAMGDSETKIMDYVSFITDVNGARNPNRENKGSGYYDIRGYNGATFSDGEGCEGYYKNGDCMPVTSCDGYVEKHQCYDKDDCDGFIVSYTCLPASYCSQEIDTTNKTCPDIGQGGNVTECEEGYYSNGLACVSNNNCNGYIENNVCKDKSTCRTGYILGQKCHDESECTERGGVVNNYECVLCSSDKYLASDYTCVSKSNTCKNGYIKNGTCHSASECDGGNGYIVDYTCHDVSECSGYINSRKHLVQYN